MKKQIKFIIIAAVMAGCGKTIDYSNDFSTATFINASPGSPAVSVLVDSVNQTNTGVVYRGASLPLNIAPGSRNLLLRIANPALPGTFLFPGVIPSQSFLPNTSSTYVAYDAFATPATSSSTLKTIRLTDDLSEAPVGFIKFRYLHLAVNAAPCDITFLRTSAPGPDSITISNRSYIGANPTQAQIDASSTFLQFPAGQNYTIKHKLAGTQTVLASASFSTLIGGVSRGNFTAFTTGGASGFPLELRVVRQTP